MESKFTFYRSYYEMALKLPNKESQNRFLIAVMAYALDGIEPVLDDDPMAEICFVGAKPNIDASLSRAQKMRENGAKGGRPAKDKTKQKPSVKPIGYEPKHHQEKPSAKPSGNQSPINKEDKYKYIYPSSNSAPCGTAAAKAAPQSLMVCKKCGQDVVGNEQDGWFCSRCNSMTFHVSEKLTDGTQCPPEIAAKIKAVM